MSSPVFDADLSHLKKPAGCTSCRLMNFARGSDFLSATAFEAFVPLASKHTEQGKYPGFIGFGGKHDAEERIDR